VAQSSANAAADKRYSLVTRVWGFNSTKELYEKLLRERKRITEATERGDDEGLADHIWNFAVTGISIRDWLGEETGSKGPEHYFHSTPCLQRLWDIAIESKHGGIKQNKLKYVVTRSFDNTAVAAGSISVTFPKVRGEKGKGFQDKSYWKWADEVIEAIAVCLKQHAVP
jgi:hypothetical protein